MLIAASPTTRAERNLPTVLLVQNDDDRAETAKVLSRGGLAVVEARGLSDALLRQALHHTPPAALICDAVLGERDSGLHLARLVAEADPSIRCLLLTRSAEDTLALATLAGPRTRVLLHPRGKQSRVLDHVLSLLQDFPLAAS